MNTADHDFSLLLDLRHKNGADFWAGPEGKVYVGNPFSTVAVLGMLHELVIPREHEAVSGALELLLQTIRDDGRVVTGPRTPDYPCYSAEVLRMLCRFGMQNEAAVKTAVAYLIQREHKSGGLRCNFTKFGSGPETAFANPGASLYALDVLRFFPEYRMGFAVADRAVKSLLEHWEVRMPTGPCHWGIGSQFFTVEYPFLRYNLFYYLYVLAHFPKARGDSRFREAWEALQTNIDDAGEILVGKSHRRLGKFSFWRSGEGFAQRRYRELCELIA